MYAQCVCVCVVYIVGWEVFTEGVVCICPVHRGARSLVGQLQMHCLAVTNCIYEYKYRICSHMHK